MNTFVAHGKNSGVDNAVKFSNTPESELVALVFMLLKTPIQVNMAYH
jgi:hypothetical protein